LNGVDRVEPGSIQTQRRRNTGKNNGEQASGDQSMKIPQLIAFAAALAVYGTGIAADPVYITCPTKQVKADVSTKLPEGWWYTPTEGKLKNLRVQTIGGDRVLVCLYQAFDGQVAVMQKAPIGAGACHADKKQQRFVCQPKGATAPAGKPTK
jgi:hypothetical protein